MEWSMFLIFLIGGLLILLALGLPIASAFLLTNFVGAYFIMGGVKGLNLAVQQIFTGLTNFTLAPPYEVTHHTMGERVTDLIKYIFPLGIFFLVLGFIFLGVATPSEAAATGALGSMILAAAYGRLSISILRKSITGTLLVMVMAFGYDPIWFAILMLVNLEMAMSTPPFGLLLFVMKGVAPPGTSMGDIIKGALPFLCCDLVLMIILIAFPSLALILPHLM